MSFPRAPWWHDHQLMWIGTKQRFICYCGHSQRTLSSLEALKRDALAKGDRS